MVCWWSVLFCLAWATNKTVEWAREASKPSNKSARLSLYHVEPAVWSSFAWIPGLNEICSIHHQISFRSPCPCFPYTLWCIVSICNLHVYKHYSLMNFFLSGYLLDCFGFFFFLPVLQQGWVGQWNGFLDW